MVYLIPLACLLGGVALGTWLGMRRQFRLLATLLLPLAAAFAWGLLRAGQGEDQWDGLGHAIMAVFWVLPAMLGLLLGATGARFRAWRRR